MEPLSTLEVSTQRLFDTSENMSDKLFWGIGELQCYSGGLVKGQILRYVTKSFHARWQGYQVERDNFCQELYMLSESTTSLEEELEMANKVYSISEYLQFTYRDYREAHRVLLHTKGKFFGRKIHASRFLTKASKYLQLYKAQSFNVGLPKELL